jgi:hypothetical protein
MLLASCCRRLSVALTSVYLVQGAPTGREGNGSSHESSHNTWQHQNLSSSQPFADLSRHGQSDTRAIHGGHQVLSYEPLSHQHDPGQGSHSPFYTGYFGDLLSAPDGDPSASSYHGEAHQETHLDTFPARDGASSSTSRAVKLLSPEEIEEYRRKRKISNSKYELKLKELGANRNKGERIPKDCYRKDPEKMANGEYDGLDPATRKLDPRAYDREHFRRARLMDHLLPSGELTEAQANRMKTEELEDRYDIYKIKKKLEQIDPIPDLNSDGKKTRTDHNRRTRLKRWMVDLPLLQHISDRKSKTLEELAQILSGIVYGGGSNSAE